MRPCSILFATVLCVPDAQAVDTVALFRSIDGSVAGIEAVDMNGSVTARGSAVVIGQNALVTRCEIVEGAISLRLSWKSKPYLPKVTHRDVERGLCLLSAPLEGRVALPKLADRAPEPGASIYVVSHTRGAGPTFSPGVVAAPRSSHADGHLSFSAPLFPGAAGSALFDERGQLVGIAEDGARAGGTRLASPARWIDEIAQRADRQTELAVLREVLAVRTRAEQWRDAEAPAANWTKAAPRDPDAWISLATVQWNLKRADLAEQSFLRAIEAGSDREFVVPSLVYVRLQQNKIEGAESALRSALSSQPRSAPLWRMLGALQFQARQFDEAAKSMRRAIELDPWSPEAYGVLASIARARGDLPGAIAFDRHVIRAEPTSRRAWLILAEDCLLARAPGDAIDAIARAESLSREGAPLEKGDIAYFKGRVASAEGRRMDAVAWFRKSIEQKPGNPAIVWHALADEYYALHLYAGAIAAYRETLRLDPSSVSARRWLIVALKDDRQLDEALTLLEKMRSENPKDDFVWRQIGMVRAGRADSEGAIAAFRESLALDPKQPKLWAALAVQATRARKRSEALQAYETLREMDTEWAAAAYREGVRYWEVKP